ncbi:MAG: hypothetical protein JKY65_04805 [Planctomycetes bacterium]|nr:hypothetical protein [Planctomycetota bacterium]
MSSGYYDPEQADPYGNPYPQPRRKPYLLYGLLAGIVLCGACCVLSCVFLAFFGFNLITDQVRQDVSNVPAFRAEIGELRKIDLKIVKSGNDNDGDTWLFDVAGDKGSGELWARVEDTPGGGQKVTEAWLRTSSGARVDLIEKEKGPR